MNMEKAYEAVAAGKMCVQKAAEEYGAPSPPCMTGYQARWH